MNKQASHAANTACQLHFAREHAASQLGRSKGTAFPRPLGEVPAGPTVKAACRTRQGLLLWGGRRSEQMLTGDGASETPAKGAGRRPGKRTGSDESHPKPPTCQLP